VPAVRTEESRNAPSGNAPARPPASWFSRPGSSPGRRGRCSGRRRHSRQLRQPGAATRRPMRETLTLPLLRQEQGSRRRRSPCPSRCVCAPTAEVPRQPQRPSRFRYSGETRPRGCLWPTRRNPRDRRPEPRTDAARASAPASRRRDEDRPRPSARSSAARMRSLRPRLPRRRRSERSRASRPTWWERGPRRPPVQFQGRVSGRVFAMGRMLKSP
jgi:hypothetical protein